MSRDVDWTVNCPQHGAFYAGFAACPTCEAMRDDSEPAPAATDTPREVGVADIVGLVPDMTEGLSAEEHVRQLRGDSSADVRDSLIREALEVLEAYADRSADDTHVVVAAFEALDELTGDLAVAERERLDARQETREAWTNLAGAQIRADRLERELADARDARIAVERIAESGSRAFHDMIRHEATTPYDWARNLARAALSRVAETGGEA